MALASRRLEALVHSLDSVEKNPVFVFGFESNKIKTKLIFTDSHFITVSALLLSNCFTMPIISDLQFLS